MDDRLLLGGHQHYERGFLRKAWLVGRGTPMTQYLNESTSLQ